MMSCKRLQFSRPLQRWGGRTWETAPRHLLVTQGATKSNLTLHTTPPQKIIYCSLARKHPTRPRQALRDFDEAFLDRAPDAGVAFEPCAAGFWSLPPDPAPSVVVLFLHGGSYSAYAPDDPWYRALASRIAAASRVAVLSARYRLAPAHPFPAALDDARAALAAARDRAGRVVLFGDSAGAGLAAALALEGGAAGLAALSGLFDLTASGRSYATRRFRGGGGDPIFRDGPDEERRSTIRDGLVYLGRVDGDGDAREDDVERVLRSLPRRRTWCCWRRAPVGDAELSETLRDGRLSPRFAPSLKRLPRSLLLVGDAEVLLDDTLALAARAARDGVAVDVAVFERMWHDWPLYRDCRAVGGGAVLEEADAAIALIAAWLRRHFVDV